MFAGGLKWGSWGRLTKAQAAHNAQQGARHVVEWECEVDHIVLAGAAQLVETLALQDLQVADPSSLGEACGVVVGEIREGAALQALPPSLSLLAFPQKGQTQG